ncbi:MAG TPA: hypothetical protein VES36_00030 [Candidatus Limnocylindrales bacterium]|nr:hypothetical protein [Candidatus Limnocylindrales bacterium]
MSDRRAQGWGRLRQRGQLRFILVHGVVVWGGATAVITAAFSALIGSERAFVEQLGINLIGFPLAGGIVYGPLVWATAEYQYERWQQAVARRHTHAS